MESERDAERERNEELDPGGDQGRIAICLEWVLSKE